jgi:hypothetical protein
MVLGMELVLELVLVLERRTELEPGMVLDMGLEL